MDVCVAGALGLLATALCGGIKAAELDVWCDALKSPDFDGVSLGGIKTGRIAWRSEGVGARSVGAGGMGAQGGRCDA